MCEQSIFIKNMVCDRCVLVVRRVVNDLGLDAENINMGIIKLVKALTYEQTCELERKLSALGFELIKDKRSLLVEEIKIRIIEYVNQSMVHGNIKLSQYLNERLRYEYNYLSSAFSMIENISIEQYIISHKVEKVKELMFVENLSLTEIAYELGYSSLAHLSAQFKKATGCSPSYYRKCNDINSRQALDKMKIA